MNREQIEKIVRSVNVNMVDYDSMKISDPDAPKCYSNWVKLEDVGKVLREVLSDC